MSTTNVTRAPRTWLITGSSRGFGRSLAEAVLAAGDNLVATARNPMGIRDLVEEFGNRVLPFPLDVTEPEQARAAVAAAVERFGCLDVVVNNAGYANLDSIEHIAEDDLRAQVETNLWGVVNVTRAALPVLHRQRAGHVIQFSSIGGRQGSPALGAYQLSKFAVGGFSEVLATEVAPLGIKVTIIEPGGFRTDWAGASMRTPDCLDPDYEPTVGAMIRRLRGSRGHEDGDPDRAARVILDVVELADPPLRLLLGTYALERAADILERQSASDRKWAYLSTRTDFPPQDTK
ncbi:oxidoreductase [Nocardia sp. NPDC059228]|uniref:oxidoreductase n=1 Tax=Nocardia sp. NPDC059228 TaxID=3346777 RepID=UPI00368C2399